MIFKSLCRNAEIGANSYLIATDRARIVLDAGMHPKLEGLEAVPHYEWIGEELVDAVVVSHAHLDHVGTLPVLLRQQPQARVFLTRETAELTLAMLHNSVSVMQAKRSELGLAEYPLYQRRELDELKERIVTPALKRRFDLDDRGEMRATFHDAGHILGSAGVVIEAEGRRVMYTGDVNFEASTVQCAADFPLEPVDALIVETTRGDTVRRADYDRQEEENEFAESIRRVIGRGGAVLVPVFAMGKTQEVLGMIHRFKDEGRIESDTPVWIGGLSTKMTHIYDRFSNQSCRLLRGFEFLRDMEIEGAGRRRGEIPMHGGSIYALSSGMMTERTVSHGFARQGLLENKRHGLFFVGYCDPDTPGGRIRAARPGSKVALEEGGPEVELRCEMRAFDFSGHATREAILDYILKLRPPKVFLVHGDRPALEWFRARLAADLPASEVVVAEPGRDYVI